MFCPNCGNQVAEGQSFCANCGTKMQAPAQPVQQPVQPTYEQPVQQSVQPTYAQPVQQPVYQQAPEQLQPQHPMKWYKFLIYFSLFASAVLNTISGIVALTGNQYTVNGKNVSELIYGIFDGLQVFDMVFGAACLALAVLAVYTRFRLSGFYANGPKMLNAVYIVAAILNLAYVIGVSVIVDGYNDITFDYSSQIAQLAISIAMVCANTTYFNKRKELFVK